MAYIGRNIDNLSDRVKLDAITASATATYNLLLSSAAYTPSSAESLTVSLNGVIQAPQTSYSVSGSTIIFASALTSSDSIEFILAERAITLTTIGSGTVTTANLVDGSVTGANFNADVISSQTAFGAEPADTDELLVSDAGVIKRVDYSYIKSSNTPAFLAYNVATQAVSNATNTQLNFGTELYDTASAFTSNTFTVPSGEGGKYFIGGGFRIDGGADAKYAQLNVYVNDSLVFNFTNRMVGDETHSFNGSITYTLSASDTVKLYTKQNSGSSQNYTSESGEKRQFFTMCKLIGV